MYSEVMKFYCKSFLVFTCNMYKSSKLTGIHSVDIGMHIE